jgi:predicted PurR-regulated permease PerM
MAAPLLVGLALGTVMAFTAQSAHARLAVRLGHRRALAAAIATLGGGILMAGGGAFAVWLVVRELVAAAALVKARLTQVPPSELFGPRASRALGWLGVDREQLVERLREQVAHAADVAAKGASVVLSASAGVVLTLVVALWTMYYVLVDWPRIATHLERLLPLNPRHTRALIDEFRDVGRRAFVGAVASAGAQGVLSGVGFAVFGVPQPVTWAALLAVLSFIPVIGVLLVWVPAAVWLLAEGHVGRALGLTAWSLLVVMAGNDYVLRPRLVGRRGDAHPLLMLVSLLGGISVFGIAGIIVGPVVMSLFVAAARIYERERD